MIVHLLFPGGKAKAFTLSYDDGVESDFRLADIMRKNGVRGTFNINSGIKRMCEDTPYRAGEQDQPRCRMNRSRFLEFYEKNHDIGEIAAHGLTHAYMTKMEKSSAVWEVIADRKNLEDMLGVPCRGFAYPYGVLSDETVEALSCSGFRYARTTKVTSSFSLPTSPLRWECTCKHGDPQLFSLANEFLAINPEETDKKPFLFSVWGHSYEFNMDDNWQVIEELLSLVGNRDDIWYATNMEIFDYLRAYKNLEFFVDQSAVYNPGAIPVELEVMITRSKPTLHVKVMPGQLIKFNEI